MGSRRHNVKRNAIWAFTNRVLQTVVPFAVRTVLIYVMGAQYVGLGGLFGSIIKVMNLADLGFSHAITYNMYKPIADGDIDKTCALLNLYRKIYRVVGTFVFCVGIVILPFIPRLIKGDYPSEINIYVLFLFYVINTTLSYFLFAYRTSLLNAYQRYDVLSIIQAVSAIIISVLEIVFIIFTHNYYLYVLASVIGTLANNTLVFLTSRRLIPEIVCRGDIDVESKKNIWIQVRALLGHRIGTVVITSADNIVISVFLGLVAVANFNNYYYIIASLIGIIDVILGGMTASIGNSIVTETKEYNYHLFSVMNFGLMWFVGWCSICFITLVQDFITLWIGPDYLYSSFVTVVLFGVYFYTLKMRSITLRYKEAAGMWNDDFWKPYVSAIVNLIVNIILVQFIGVNGVLLSTILTVTFINLPWEIFVLCNNYFMISSKEYYINLIMNIILTIAVGAIVTYICGLISLQPIVSFLIKSVICVILPNLLFYIVYRKNENLKYALRMIIH